MNGGNDLVLDFVPCPHENGIAQVHDLGNVVRIPPTLRNNLLEADAAEKS